MAESKDPSNNYGQQLFANSDNSFHESEEQVQVKTALKKQQQPASKAQSNIEPSRQVKRSKQKTKKRINNPAPLQSNLKKDERKCNAAPSLNSNSQKSTNSEKSQKSDSEKAAPEIPKQSARLYIGNLPIEFDQSQMYNLFKKYGSLKEAKLIINSTTGKSKCFGFVQYKQIDSAIKAKMQMSMQILDGQKITIQFCELE